MERLTRPAALLLAAVCLVSLTGATKLGTELSDLMVLQSIGVDCTETGFRVTAEMLRGNRNGTPDNTGGGAVTRLCAAEGRTVAEALYRLPLQSGGKPFLAHNRVLVIGGENLQSLPDVLAFFTRDFGVRASQLLCVSRGCTAAELLAAKLPASDVRGETLENVLTEAADHSVVPAVRLPDACNAFADGTSALCVPAVAVTGKGENVTYAVSGGAFFNHDGRFAGFLEPDVTFGIALLDNRLRGGSLTVPLPDGGAASLLLVRGKTQYDVTAEAGVPAFHAAVSLVCDIKEFSANEPNETTITRAAETAVQDAAERTFSLLQTSPYGDCARFGVRLRWADRAAYRRLSPSWQGAFRACGFSCSVRVTIRRVGEATFS